MHSASLMTIFTGNCFPCSYLSDDRVSVEGWWTKPWLDVLPADRLIPGCSGSCRWTCPTPLFSGEAPWTSCANPVGHVPPVLSRVPLAPRWPDPGASKNLSEFLLLEDWGVKRLVVSRAVSQSLPEKARAPRRAERGAFCRGKTRTSGWIVWCWKLTVCVPVRIQLG